MKKHLYRYFKKGVSPCESITEFSNEEAIRFMVDNFPAHSWFHASPMQRLEKRRSIERWLFGAFSSKGGHPKTPCPCYFSLGSSEFLQNLESFEGEGEVLEITLESIPRDVISFTWPDSFFSDWLFRNPHHKLYQEGIHGEVFTCEEIIQLIEANSIDTDIYMKTEKYDYHFYVEAQVWDKDLLKTFVDPMGVP